MKTKCIEWTMSFDTCGYGHKKVNGVLKKAHRVAWETTYGSIPKGMCVLHRCDNTACIRPSHLFLGTRDDNMKDRNRKGRQARGESHGNVKLTEAEVVAIRSSLSKGIPYTDLAEIYRVSPPTIHNIWTRKIWRHI